jgi:hypothetical protein
MKDTAPMPSSAIDKESLRTEYTATQDAYLHYDSFSWQVGSILIAGAFVFWGFLLDKNVEPSLIGTGACLISLLMSAWFMYTHHCRQIYLAKLHRIYQIEELLGMEQHRRWMYDGDKKPLYQTFGPHGYQLDQSIYLLTALGALAIGLAKFGLNPWLALPLPVVAFTLLIVRRNERRVKEYLGNKEGTAGNS